MKGNHYKTRYSSIVPKGAKGECIDIVNNNSVNALLIKFFNGEQFWFLMRDLED